VVEQRAAGGDVGGRDRALRYGSKGEAARAVERLRLGAVTIERMTEDERG
jgi:hypothetical protein